MLSLGGRGEMKEEIEEYGGRGKRRAEWEMYLKKQAIFIAQLTIALVESLTQPVIS